MKCTPSDVPSAEEIDIEAMRAKYAAERDKRLRKDGENQYVHPTGDHLPDYSIDPYTEMTPREPITREIDVVILGAGWGGVMAGYHLAKAGVEDFANVDTGGDFGGVWYWNQYPGIQCDNESYCYLPLLEETGFMPSKKFADGWEIQGYARQIADKFGFAEKAIFHTQITSLVWDEELHRWRVFTNRGDDIKARFVIMAGGVLNMPKLPGVPGLDDFEGKIFHTSRWDYDYTGGEYGNPQLTKLTDKKVGILGTGATAIQAVPHLAKFAQELYVIQRTPSCVDARPNPPTREEWVQSLEPGWQAERQDNFHRGAMETFAPDEPDLVCDFWTEINRNMQHELGEEGWPELSMEEFLARRDTMDHRVMERFRRRVDQLVKDPQVAEALKPYYNFMCKRPLSSEDFYPTFNEDHVHLIDVSGSKGLERLTAKGFVAGGEEYEVDCMIFASGFEVTSALEKRWGIEKVLGRNGVSIYDHWREGPLTLHGTMTHGFPNQFYIGYIQGGLNASVTEQFGRQGEHIAYIVAQALERGAEVVEPEEEAVNAYVEHFEATTIDQSAFLDNCTPSYFNNEGAGDHKWGLFRPWGAGWNDFMRVLAEWRDEGALEGLKLHIPEREAAE